MSVDDLLLRERAKARLGRWHAIRSLVVTWTVIGSVLLVVTIVIALFLA